MKFLKVIGRAFAGMIGIMAAVTAFMCGSGSVRAAQEVQINEVTFPDPVFRSVVAGSDIDRDGNGILDETEISITTNIYCEGMGIRSVQGVEYFTALQGLWCKDNEIESMDLSKNKDIHGVWCSGNRFTSLDFSENPELEWVYCYDCNLTNLNVSNNPKLAFLECNTNPLGTLDVTHNPVLEHLTCGTCELTSLDVSRNPKLSHLDAFQNHLTALDVTKNPKLKRLDIWNNPGLGSIDVSNNPGLQYYNCAYNGATSVDVSGNPELQKLICSYNSIRLLDLSHNPKLFYLDCADNQIGALDLSENSELHFLQAFTNSFTTLDIGSNRFLIKTYTDGVKKDESAVCNGHSWTIDYGGDSSTGDDDLYFLCFDDTVTLLAEPADRSSEKDKASEEKASDKKENGDFVTRETVIWTLYDLAGKPSVSSLDSRFSDVKKDAWYEDALLWGERNSICVGYPDVSSDDFGVGEWVTRQDMALMLMRYSEYKGYKRAIDFGRTDDYTDYYDIDQYAWEAVTWAVTWNIMSGKVEPGSTKEEQKFDPHGKVTRGEFEETLKSMLAVNGVSAPAVIPVPDMRDTGKDDAEDDTLKADAPESGNAAEQDEPANVSADEAEATSKAPDGELSVNDAVYGSRAGDSSDGERENDNDRDNGSNHDIGTDSAEDTEKSGSSLSPVIIILVVLGAAAAVAGYKIISKYKK